jgi:small-conductance mechanosensitive channel
MATLLVLWFAQLQVFFVSLLAVAAAIVIAFKELIMCFTGGILLRTSKTFKEGDRIQLDEVRGFVIERSLLSTKILEIGPEKNSQQTTGDIITIPNSLMLSHTVKNESYFKGYSIKSFVFKIPEIQRADVFEAEILAEAKKIVEDYYDEAKKSISKFCEKEGIIIPSMEPRTKVLIDEEEYDLLILVKLPIRNDKIADIEQQLNRFYLKWRISLNA